MNSPDDQLISEAKSYFSNGDYKSAIRLCNNLLSKNPDNIDALNITAAILLFSKKFEHSIKIYDKLILLSKKNSTFYYNRALAYMGLNNIKEAESNYKLAIKYDSESLPALINLGNLYHQQDISEQAIKYYSKACLISPNDEKIYTNMGLSYLTMKVYDKSLEQFKKALKINPKYEEAIFGLGNCYDGMGKSLEAIKCFKDVITVNPKHSRALFNLSNCQLAIGDFYNGWINYDSRFDQEILKISYLLSINLPLWDRTKKITNLLVIAEQGIGDQVLFYSLLNELLKFNINVTVMTDAKMRSLFHRSIKNISFIERGKKIDEEKFDAYIPMCDLGKIFRNSYSDFQNFNGKYLIADETRVRLIQSKMQKSKIKCGVSWKSNNPYIGRDKSFHIEMLEPLLKNQDIQFVNLQYGDVKNDLEIMKDEYRSDILDTKDIDNYNDIEGLVALISSCDIVVTADNSNAHLAGALGKETYLILPKTNSLIWYWEHQINETSLWYSSVNTFKQIKTDQWNDPILRANKIIKKKYF